MKTLRERQNNVILEPHVGQQGLFRSPEGYLFTQETIDALSELGDVIRSIRKRLMSEGYEVKDGKIYKNGIQQEN